MGKVKEILASASQSMKDPDGIIDLYTLHFIWLSRKGQNISGYGPREIKKKRATDFLEVPQFVKDLIIENQILKGAGISNSHLKRKDGGLVKISTQYTIFEMQDGLFMAFKYL